MDRKTYLGNLENFKKNVEFQPCLSIADWVAFKIVEIDSLDIGYGSNVWKSGLITSRLLISTHRNYST